MGEVIVLIIKILMFSFMIFLGICLILATVINLKGDKKMDLDDEELRATRIANGADKQRNIIIKFKSKTDNVIDFLEDAIVKVKEYKADNVLIAIKLNGQDGYVLTGYHNLNMAEKQELIGHIQIDVIDEMIHQNYITPD